MARTRSGHAGSSRGLPAGATPGVAYGKYGTMFDLPPAKALDLPALRKLAEAMIKPDAGKPITESETVDENPTIPAGYTYFGQFVDHDITFDPTPLTDATVDPQALVDFRSPSLDLDNVYGRGPDDQPYMYEPDGLRLRVGRALSATPPAAVGTRADLPRLADGTAILGDKRNDENKIVSQVQGAMIHLHNKVVDDPGLLVSFLGHAPDSPAERFRTAATIVRWHYQWVVVFDFLDRICAPGVVDEVFNGGAPMLPHYLKEEAKYPYLPVEFAVAAYRFGHSMVRPSYALNRAAVTPPGSAPGDGRIPTFSRSTGWRQNLNGLPGTLPDDWGIDFSFFFDGLTKPSSGADGFKLPQPSYRIDALLAGPLQDLPEFFKQTDNPANAGSPIGNLAFRNLQRGQMLQLPSGEAVCGALGIEPLGPHILWSAGSRLLVEEQMPAADRAELQRTRARRQAIWSEFGAGPLAGNTPLWYYILREAEYYGVTNDPNEPGVGFGGQHLGPVGSRIIAETLIGLLWLDPGSFLHDTRGFRPMPHITGGDKLTLPLLLRYALSPANPPAHSPTPGTGTRPMPLTPRLTLAPGSLDKWGRLVKSWATKLDYVDVPYESQPPRDYSTRGYPLPPPPSATTPDTDSYGTPKPWTLPPMGPVKVDGPDGEVTLPFAVAISVAEFSKRLAAAHVEVTLMPSQYTKVILVQGDESIMVLRLPPKDTLQGSEDDLLNGQPYPFNDFYQEYYGNTPPTAPTVHADIMELHANRIGEYTLNNCN